MESNLLANSENITPEISSFRLIVVNASAGGLNALTELVAQLPKEGAFAVFIVLHLSKKALGDYLVHRLQSITPYTCQLAKDQEPIRPHNIYLAPPDRHLMVKADGHVLIGHGPIENRWRPSVDVLFRSAAAAYGPLVIGIVLTGLLDDGVFGMLNIRKTGGITIVQDPNAAEYPDMPLAVLNTMEVDYCLPLAEMGAYLEAISLEPFPEPVPILREVLVEAQIVENVAIGMEYPRFLGEKSLFSCPDCGGGLWEITDDKFHRYRCHVGHSYTEQDLAVRQAEAMESTLWIALRMIEERRNLLDKMAAQYRRRGLVRISAGYAEKVINLKIHTDRLKEVLFTVQNA